MSSLEQVEDHYQPVGQIPLCHSHRCISLLYSPNTRSSINKLMNFVAQQNNLSFSQIMPLNATKELSLIMGLPDQASMQQYLINNPNKTQAAVSFEDEYNFTIWYNSSCVFGACAPDIRPQVYYAIVNALLITEFGSTRNVTYSISYSSFPFVTDPYDALGNYGFFLIYCGFSFFFIILTYQVVLEKEKKLRLGMHMMGMTSAAYWFSWFLTALLMNVIISLVTIGSGMLFQLAFFSKTNFFVLFLMFFLFLLSMTTFGFFLSSILERTKATILISMVFVVVGAIFQIMLSVVHKDFFSYIYEVDNTGSTILKVICSFLPFFHFSKSMYDVNKRSFVGDISRGFSWNDIYVEYKLGNGGISMSTKDTFLLMIGLAGFYALLTWYCDNVISGAHGVAKPFYFFLEPFFHKKKEPNRNYSMLEKFKSEPQDEDVEEEHFNALMKVNCHCRILRLSKIYSKYSLVDSADDVVALVDFNLELEEGTLFCLLGQNGAGKTTTINILTGLFAPTVGDAVMYGKSIISETAEVRKLIGVCPQYDILWDELTAYEHLELFASLKEVDETERSRKIQESLNWMKLHQVQHKQVKKFSGGMKRRLSVAISTIGDPKILFLDEPTSGMDPASRRYVWNLIQNLKKDRVIILTTHSMEEADILGDKIAILAKGKMRCIGSPLKLKTKFGDGYKIDLIPKSAERLREILDLVKFIPEAKVVSQSEKCVKLAVPAKQIQQISPFLKHLETIPPNESPLADWGINHTTLEDVFLKLVDRTAQAHDQ